MKVFLFSVVGLWLCVGARWVFGAEAVVAAAGGSVTLSLEEFKALYEKGQQSEGAGGGQEKSPEPPLAAAVMEVVLRLEFERGRAVLSVFFEVENFSGRWVSVPLLGAGAVSVLEKELGEARLVNQDEKLCLMCPAATRQQVQLRILGADVGGQRSGEWLLMELDLLPTAVGRFECGVLPEGRALRVRWDGMETLLGAGGVCGVPARGGRLAVVMLGEAQEPGVPEVVEVAQWMGQQEVLVRREDGVLRYAVRSFLQVVKGAGHELRMELPLRARQVAVTGEGGLVWRVERMGDGGQVLVLRWSEQQLLERELRVSYDVFQAVADGAWELEAPGFEGGAEMEVRMVVGVPAGVSLAGEGLLPVRDVSTLPGWMREDLDGAVAAMLDGRARARLQVRDLPLAETVSGEVKLCGFESRVVTDGAVMTEARYELEYEGQAEFGLRLPEGGRLLRCALDGVGMRPLQGEDGGLTFRLAGKVGGGSAKALVTLSFTALPGALDPVTGKVRLELPVTDWFVHRQEWLVGLPEGYRVSAVDGNVAFGEASGSSHEVKLLRRLVRDEAAVAELFYEKSGL